MRLNGFACRSQRMSLEHPRWSEASGASNATLHVDGLPRMHGWGAADAAQSRHEATAGWAAAAHLAHER